MVLCFFWGSKHFYGLKKKGRLKRLYVLYVFNSCYLVKSVVRCSFVMIWFMFFHKGSSNNMWWIQEENGGKNNQHIDRDLPNETTKMHSCLEVQKELI